MLLLGCKVEYKYQVRVVTISDVFSTLQISITVASTVTIYFPSLICTCLHLQLSHSRRGAVSENLST